MSVRFEVDHVTTYTYSRPVFLEPQLVRLRPSCDLAQHVHRFALEIEPPPAGRTELTDAEGNGVTHVWFDGLTDRLVVRSSFEAETLRGNPFDFVVLDPGGLPPRYAPAEREALARFLAAEDPPAAAALAEEAAGAAGDVPEAFAMELTRRINARFVHEVRERGEPHPAAETLARGRGSCRDLTVLYVEACRAAGLAARFVSGYQEGDPSVPAQHMHAWAEAYLPGAGWRGYDPTNGIAVADGHVAVARAPGPAGAAPTAGTFRGTGVRAQMRAEVAVRVSPSARARGSRS